MTKGGTLITQTKTSSTTTSGMNWTAASSGDFELGWRFYYDKTNSNGLLVGTYNMQLTVSVTFIQIDGDTATRTSSTIKSFTLSLKSCSDSSLFTVPTAPATILYDRNN
jgi:hypothetical protein